MSEPQASHLSELIEDLEDDGVRDSSGEFTLDPREAERKLANFALARPEDYVLKLAQCAVAIGADEMHLRTSSSQVEVFWNGPSLNRDDLPGVMGHLLSAHSPANRRHLRHLAAGLRGAVGMSPSNLWLESGSGPAAFRRTWRQDSWVDVARPERVATGTVVSLIRDLSSTLGEMTSDLGAFLQGRGNRSDEEQALRAAVGYFPITVVVNSKILARRPFGQPRYDGYRIQDDEFPGECRPPRYLVAQDPTSYVDALVHRYHHLIEREVVDPSGSLPRLGERHASVRLGQEEGRRCRAWVALAAEMSKAARIAFVEDGLLLAEEEVELGVPGLVAVLSVERLSKDLTGLQLVRDRAYSELLGWLKSQGEELARELLQHLDDIPIRDTVRQKLGSFA